MDTTLQDPLVGHLLDGRYRVECRIARGGMAAVYLAVDTRLDRTVAIKVMHPGLAADEESVSRFIREAKSAARLSHPNVVAIFDQGTDGDAVFLVMEHVQGRTLRDVLLERGHLTVRQALEVFEPVLAALGAAHGAGIVHRDVKPENVLLADDGRVKVADFGLARAVSASTSSSATQGMLLGTVAYLSPEQVESGVADARSDVYAAGIVLFELLTGRKPFAGSSPIQVAYRHVHDDVPPPSSRRPGVPAELDDVVVRATNRDPDARPADATRLLADVVAARLRIPDEALDAVGAPGLVPLGDDSGEMWPAAASSDPDRTVLVSRDGVSRDARRLPRDGLEHTLVVETGPPASGPAPPPGEPGAPASPPRPRRRRRGAVALVLLLALVAALAAAGWYVGAGPGSFMSTPSLIGLTEGQAQDRAAQAGLGVELGDREYSEDVPAGEVLRTVPEPSADIKKDGTVTVVLSKGPERYAVPSVVGMSRENAEAELAAANLSVGEVDERYDEQVAEGDVIAVTPVVGERLRRDTPVDLVVSRGREPIEVADVTRHQVDEAREILTASGLRVAVQERYHERIAEGLVISQSPDTGTLFRGDTVELVVSQGPPLVDVPRVLDRRVGQARGILEAAGFEVRTRGTRILNRVIMQSPGGGAHPKGSTVTLTTI